MNHRKSAQRGGVLFVLIFVALLAYLGLVGAQVMPTVLEYQSIVKAVKKSADASSVPEVRNNFDKAAVADDIKSITGKDLEIPGKDGDKVLVKFAYTKEVHLFGPAYILMKYAGQSK